GDGPMDQPPNALMSRLDRLERENRRWRFVGLAALMLVGLILAPGATGQPNEVRARRFVVVDDTGRMRAMLGSAVDFHGGLRLYGPGGDLRVALSIWDETGPSLNFYGKGGGFAHVVLSLDDAKNAAGLELTNTPPSRWRIWKAP
ncbi:MAG: hypothetical protein ACREMB_08740, partial [Candidatus Rokuibacteriota bacterium]